MLQCAGSYALCARALVVRPGRRSSGDVAHCLFCQPVRLFVPVDLEVARYPRKDSRDARVSRFTCAQQSDPCYRAESPLALHLPHQDGGSRHAEGTAAQRGEQRVGKEPKRQATPSYAAAAVYSAYRTVKSTEANLRRTSGRRAWRIRAQQSPQERQYQ